MARKPGPYHHQAFSPALPGMGLKEYLEISGLSYSAFARLIPCAVSYPRLLAEGLARPSYEMAVRIENLTGGCVPRVRWYPAGDERVITDPPGDYDEDEIFNL